MRNVVLASNVWQNIGDFTFVSVVLAFPPRMIFEQLYFVLELVKCIEFCLMLEDERTNR